MKLLRNFGTKCPQKDASSKTKSQMVQDKVQCLALNVTVMGRELRLSILLTTDSLQKPTFYCLSLLIS
jgi:hypothetical protein